MVKEKDNFKAMVETYEPIELVNTYIKKTVPEAKKTDGLVNLYEEIKGPYGTRIKGRLLEVEAMCSELRKQIVENPRRGDKGASIRVNKVSAYIRDVLEFHKKINEKAPSEKATESEEKAAIEKQALEILHTGRPLDFLMSVFHKDYIGGEEYGRLLFLSALCGTCRNTEGLHPGAEGDSGAGKTSAMKAAINNIPDDFKVCGKITPQSLFYNKINGSTTVFMDDVTKMDPDLERIIKLSTSFYQEGAETLSVANQQGIRPKIPPCINWWITGVDAGSFNKQILNRSVNVGLDEPNKAARQDHKMEIFLHQVDDGDTGRPALNVTREVLIAREITGHLLRAPQIYVRIVFWKDEKGDLIVNWLNVDNPRNFPVLEDLIRVSASIHRYQRKKDKNNNIIANLEDYDIALKIWNRISREQVSKLSRRHQEIFQALMDLEAYEKPVDMKALAVKLKKSPQTVYEYLHGRKNDGIKGLLDLDHRIIEYTETETEYDVKIEGEDQYERERKIGSRGRKRTLLKLTEKINILELGENVISLDREKAQQKLDTLYKELEN